MRRRLFLTLAVAGWALASCERRPTSKGEAPAAPEYSHALEADVSGEYRPIAPVRMGDATLESLYIGQKSAFEAWEQGVGGAAPLILVFSSADGSRRIGPVSYRITDDAIRFQGQAGADLPVRLEGGLDQGALAAARRNLGDRTVVIAGHLTIGRQHMPVQLMLWGGD